MIRVDEDAPDPSAIGDEIYRKMSLSRISDISSDVQSLAVTRFGTSKISVYLLALRRESQAEVDGSDLLPGCRLAIIAN